MLYCFQWQVIKCKEIEKDKFRHYLYAIHVLLFRKMIVHTNYILFFVAFFRRNAYNDHVS